MPLKICKCKHQANQSTVNKDRDDWIILIVFVDGKILVESDKWTDK